MSLGRRSMEGSLRVLEIEINNLKNLADDLLRLNTTLLDKISEEDPTDIDKLIKVRTFQHDSLQKTLALSFELEKYLLINAPLNAPENSKSDFLSSITTFSNNINAGINCNSPVDNRSVSSISSSQKENIFGLFCNTDVSQDECRRNSSSTPHGEPETESTNTPKTELQRNESFNCENEEIGNERSNLPGNFKRRNQEKRVRSPEQCRYQLENEPLNRISPTRALLELSGSKPDVHESRSRTTSEEETVNNKCRQKPTEETIRQIQNVARYSSPHSTPREVSCGDFGEDSTSNKPNTSESRCNSPDLIVEEINSESDSDEFPSDIEDVEATPENPQDPFFEQEKYSLACNKFTYPSHQLVLDDNGLPIQNEEFPLWNKEHFPAIGLTSNKNKISSGKNQVSSDNNQVSIDKNQVSSDKNQFSSHKNQSSSRRKEVSSAKNESNISLGQNKSSSVISPNSYSDDANPKRNDISKKLKSRQVLNARERYIKNLPVIPKPDIRLRPVPAGYSDSSTTTTSSPKKSPRNKKIKPVEPRQVLPKRMDLPGDDEEFIICSSKPPETCDLCYISYVVSPSEFYISKADEELSMNSELLKNLNRFYANSPCPFKNILDAKEQIKKYCVTIYEGSWYRAEVVEWFMETENTGVACVRLIDYGDLEFVHYYKLRHMARHFYYSARFAFKCSLACLYSLGSTESNKQKQWDEKCIEMLKNHIRYDVFYRISYLEVLPTYLEIDLCLNEEDKSIGDYLLEQKLVVQIIDMPVESSSEEYHDVSSGENSGENEDVGVLSGKEFIENQIKCALGQFGIKEDMSDEKKLDVYLSNTFKPEAGNINEAITNYDAQDRARTCRFAQNGTCFKGNQCKLDHEPLREDGITTDKQVVYTRAFNELPYPNPGDVLKIRVTAVVSVRKFYAQIQSGLWAEYKDQLTTLKENMNKPETIKKYQKLTILPEIGQLVAVKYCDEWFRGKVLVIDHPRHKVDMLLMVQLVDYGNEVEVDIADMRDIPTAFLDLPFQAVVCFIGKIQQNKDKSCEDATYCLESKVLSKLLDAKVTSTQCYFLEVKLFSQSNKDISLELIEEGFAIPQVIDLLPAGSDCYLVD